MNKVICDICGTQYPDTADQCPICGYAREIAGQSSSGGRNVSGTPGRGSAVRTKGGKFSASNVRKRNDKLVNEEEPMASRQPKAPKNTKQPGRNVSYSERSHGDSNPFLVVLLVVVIVLLLATTALIFVRYLLPNLGTEEPTVPTEQTNASSEPTYDTTDEGIPCEALALTSGGSIAFTAEGEMSLLNVVVIPSDSTDELVYSSSDESVATVNEEGRVTAVGEGEAVITITCGKREMQCNVTCSFVTEPSATEATGETGETTETEATTETDESDPTDE